MKRKKFDVAIYYRGKEDLLENFQHFNNNLTLQSKLKEDYYNVSLETLSAYNFTDEVESQAYYVVARVIFYIKLSIKNIK